MALRRFEDSSLDSSGADVSRTQTASEFGATILGPQGELTNLNRATQLCWVGF